MRKLRGTAASSTIGLTRMAFRRLSHWYSANFTVQRRGICVYRYDPIFAFFDRRHHMRWFVIFVFYVALFSVPKAGLAFSRGMLTSPTLAADVSADLRFFPLFRVSLRVPTSRAGEAPTPAIPYLRDYVDMGISLLMALHMALLHAKWRNLSLFLPQLWEDRILSRQTTPVSFYERLVRTYDKRVNRPLAYLIPIATALVSTAAFFWLFQSSGMYSSLSAGQPGWEQRAWASWWANPANGRWAALFEASWLSFILYYVFRHNVIGCIALLAVRTLVTRRRGSLLTLDPDHADGYGGVRNVRTIVMQIFASIAIMGFSLLLVYYMMPSGALPVLAPFLAIFFCLNPFYLIVPVVVTNREIAAFRNEALRTSRERLAAAKDIADEARIRHWRGEIDSLQTLPKALVSPAEILSLLIVYLVPLVLFYDWVLEKLWGK